MSNTTGRKNVFAERRTLTLIRAREGLDGTAEFTEVYAPAPSRRVNLTMGWFDWLDANRPLTIAVIIRAKEEEL